MIFLTDFYKPLSQLTEQAPLLRHATLPCFCPISLLDDEGSWVFTSLSPPAEPEESHTCRAIPLPQPRCPRAGQHHLGLLALLAWTKSTGLRKGEMGPSLLFTSLQLQWWKEQMSWHFKSFLLCFGYPLLFSSKSPFLVGKKPGLCHNKNNFCRPVWEALEERPLMSLFQTNNFDGSYLK